MSRTPRQARSDAEQSVRNAHRGKSVKFGEPVASGDWVHVPYQTETESGESIANTGDDSGAVQVF